MTPLERQAIRDILAAVRKELEGLLGEGQSPSAMDEQRLNEMVSSETARWQRSRVNANLPLLPNPAFVQSEVMNWLIGLGPLQRLIDNPDYEEIIVEGPREVGVIDRTGRTIMLPDVYFENDQEVRELVKRALAAVGRRVDEASPMVDARLKDGSRLNVVIPPVSDRYTLLTIRTFRLDVDTLERLVELETITQEVLLFLRAAVAAFVNIVVSGPTGSGKTSLLNALGNETDGLGRMLVIEETRELKLPELVPLCQGLEAQPANAEGIGLIEQRDLVHNALRMRPRRIVLGEVRGPEAWDMLRALNTGHKGCFSSVHANSPRDALDALVTLGMMAPERPPETVLARLISRSITLVIQMAEQPSTGRRWITHVFEITGLEGTTISGHDLWVRDEVTARLEWTGTPPKCMAEFARRGVAYSVPTDSAQQRNGVLV